MLREVKNRHIRPRIVPFQITTASTPSCIVNIGYGDITATRTGTGVGVISLKVPFSRNGTMFMTQGADAGGYATYNTANSSGSNFAYSLLAHGGGANDGTGEGFLFGWDSSDETLGIKQIVKANSFTAPRILWARITGSSGAVAIGGTGIACTRTGTGTYVIKFKPAFGASPVVMANCIGNTYYPTISAKSAAGVTVTFNQVGAAAADANFYFLALGSDSESDVGKCNTPLENNQRKPRVVVAEVTNSAGSWSKTIGSTDFGAITDNGAGDFSMTMAEPFAREGAVFAFTTTQRATISANMTGAGVVRVLTKNAGGSAADVSGKTFVLCIGSDDASEF